MEVEVSLCHQKVSINCVSPGRYQVTPWIWHPNVEPTKGHVICYDGECPLDLLRAERFPCPANISAAFLAHRDRNSYLNIAQKIEKIYRSSDECMICLEDVDQEKMKRLTCPTGHWICATCWETRTQQLGFLKGRECPLRCNQIKM
jgi:hypothetical protein